MARKSMKRRYKKRGTSKMQNQQFSRKLIQAINKSLTRRKKMFGGELTDVSTTTVDPNAATVDPNAATASATVADIVTTTTKNVVSNAPASAAYKSITVIINKSSQINPIKVNFSNEEVKNGNKENFSKLASDYQTSTGELTATIGIIMKLDGTLDKIDFDNTEYTSAI